jgi:hypothetical protein
MPLPNSGAITLAQIGTEAKIAALNPVKLGEEAVRKLANKMSPTEAISFSDLYGKVFGEGPGYLATQFAPVLSAKPGFSYVSNSIVIEGVSPLGVSAVVDATSVTVNSQRYLKDEVFPLQNGDVVYLIGTAAPEIGQSKTFTLATSGGGPVFQWYVENHLDFKSVYFPITLQTDWGSGAFPASYFSISSGGVTSIGDNETRYTGLLTVNGNTVTTSFYSAEYAEFRIWPSDSISVGGSASNSAGNPGTWSVKRLGVSTIFGVEYKYSQVSSKGDVTFSKT